jgi:PAS domain S-box-containing protein
MPHDASTTDTGLGARERVAAVHATGLIDSSSSQVLERLTRAASRLLGVPAAMASLIDDERQWIVGLSGLPSPEARQIPLSHSTCRHVVSSRAQLVVEDTATHPLLRDIPTVFDRPTRAYAGVPLTSTSGETIGALCAMDSVPRAWSEADIEGLQDLASGAMAEIELRTAITALTRSEERYRLVALATNDVIWDWDVETGALVWNDAVAPVFRYAPEDVEQSVDWWRTRIHPEDAERVVTSIHEVVAHGESGWSEEYRFRRGDGTYAEVFDRGYVARDRSGTAVRMIGAMTDLTRQRSLEERLRHSQKMEAVGQLAGGVAHDFNNLLTVIAANLDFVRADLPADHSSQPDLEEIARASERAAALVKQLLTFSRKQAVQPRRLRMSEMVVRAQQLLRRVIGEEITLEVNFDESDATVVADPGQLEQVLINLAVNARDAMLTPLHGHAGAGGTLTIDAAVVTVTAAEAATWDTVTPGRWAQVRMHDTGHGMDERTRAHVFEPFFTTKDVGAGTGLGLATVFGIVRQAGGAIRVESTLGVGTSFTCLLPIAAPIDAAEAPSEPDPFDAGVRTTVLLVEDEAPVRGAARRMLTRRGHAVIEARHGVEALELGHAHRGEIGALVTDLRMPEMGGRELVARIRLDAPELPVVYVSGYSDQGVATNLESHEAYVGKPFTSEALLSALALVLEMATSRATAAPGAAR